MMTQIAESEMIFEIDSESLYHIEKSSFLNDFPKKPKCCEFLFAKDKKVVFVEAKKTTPNPSSSDKERLTEYISNIKDKFENSLMILNSLLIGRYGNSYSNEIPEIIKQEKLSNSNYVFYLVVKKSYSDSLIKISDILKRDMKSFLKIWKIADSNIKVISGEKARELGMVTSIVP